MKICDVLTEDNIIPELKSGSKIDAINELIDLFKEDDRVLDLSQVKNSVMEREKIMSTGVGHGFGLKYSLHLEKQKNQLILKLLMVNRLAYFFS